MTFSAIKQLNAKGRPNRIMIVDDDLELVPLYEIIGQIPDTILTIQTGGHSCLRTLDRLNYEIEAVVLDLSMPDKDGLSVTKEMREQEELRLKDHPIRIFWLTGWDVQNDPTLSEAAERYGVTEVIKKPISPQDIVYKVKRYLEEPGV